MLTAAADGLYGNERLMYTNPFYSMKTPDEYLDQYGIDEKGTDSFFYEQAVNAIRAAVKDACREQREICAAHAKMGDTYLPRTDEVQYYIDKESIKNAPEPKMI